MKITSEIVFNEQQQAAINTAINFESCAIVGSAGTGKSTIMREVATRLAVDARMPLLRESTGSPVDPILRYGMPGIVAVSFTHTAVNNISRILNKSIPCFTIHKLIEFQPVIYEGEDSAGNIVIKRAFEPTRNALNPLPVDLRTIIIEESGIVSITLFQQLLAALPNPRNVQFIFLGDLFQLDPPYDPAILGYTLTSTKFKKIELTQVYRQKLHSPILKFALDIKDRIPFGSNKFEALSVSNEHGTLSIKPWKHKVDEFKATIEAGKFLRRQWEAGHYFPERDVVILPFNKRFGSTELNILIADFLGKARKAVVHEIIAGFEKKYLAVGDYIMVSKRKAVITGIKKNSSYLGTVTPQEPSEHLDRFGFNSKQNHLADAALLEADVAAHAEVDRLMAASLADNKDKMRNASHSVDITYITHDNELSNIHDTLSSVGDFNIAKFDFAFCMTCYKAQGSEWDNVYVFTHKSHAISLCNEFFYTAFTRAKKKLTVICEPDHLIKAAMKQAVPGNNWVEKSMYFSRNITKLQTVPHVAQLIKGD